VTTVSYTLWWRCYIERYNCNARIRYGSSAHVGDGWRQRLCIQNCGQTAAVRDMITIDSLQELVILLSNGTIADPLRRTVSAQYMCYWQPDRQSIDDTLCPRFDVMVCQNDIILKWSDINFYNTFLLQCPQKVKVVTPLSLRRQLNFLKFFHWPTQFTHLIYTDFTVSYWDALDRLRVRLNSILFK